MSSQLEHLEDTERECAIWQLEKSAFPHCKLNTASDHRTRRKSTPPAHLEVRSLNSILLLEEEKTFEIMNGNQA
jgi:hypothetical protein